MKLKYIITGPISIEDSFDKDINQIDTETLDSIEKIREKDEEIEYAFSFNKADIATPINEKLIGSVDYDIENKVTHYCFIPNGSVFFPHYKKIAKHYVKDNKTVFLPCVEYLQPNEEGKEDSTFKAFLNTCMWKPYGLSPLGVLNEELAVKQIDTTLYGGLIPTSVYKKYRFKEKILYYTFYEYLNRIASKNVVIKGIPKVLVRCTFDLILGDVDQQEKVKYFRACQFEYKHDADRDIQDNYQEKVYKAKEPETAMELAD